MFIIHVRHDALDFARRGVLSMICITGPWIHTMNLSLGVLLFRDGASSGGYVFSSHLETVLQQR